MKITNHEEDATIKSENFQVELGASTMQTKRERGTSHQKLPSKLSYQEKFHSWMAHFFICSSSCPPFNAFRDEKKLQMMSDVSG